MPPCNSLEKADTTVKTVKLQSGVGKHLGGGSEPTALQAFFLAGSRKSTAFNLFLHKVAGIVTARVVKLFPGKYFFRQQYLKIPYFLQNF